MSITFNSPSLNGNPNPSGQPKPSKSEKKDPVSQAKQRQKEHLQKQQGQIQKKLERLSDSLRQAAAIIFAQDPNDKPSYLFRQIRPLLNKLQLTTLADGGKTEIVEGQVNSNGESLYKIVLRRTSELTPDTISRLKRQEKSVRSIKWNSKAIEVYLWYKYESPAGQQPTAPI